MRDNYDYQHSGDERGRPNITERGAEQSAERGADDAV